jgi:RHH-type rel operon transcriptional repressor/antitoxin RelB
VLAIRLPEKIEERLERLAKRAGQTKAYYARQAIIEHLEDMEDVEIADKRLEKTPRRKDADGATVAARAEVWRQPWS